MKKTTFLIAGKHAVTEALKNPKRKVLKILLTEDSKKSLNRDNQNKNLLEDVKIYYKTKKELERLCSKDEISHQNLIAEVEHLEKVNIKEYIKSKEGKNITFVALEEITDLRFKDAIATDALSIILLIAISIAFLSNLALSLAISAIFQASCFFL